jgi:DNA invertase Pin-like site-specific DNA recombinase
MIAIYARQSVDKKDSISIDSQIDLCAQETEGREYKVYKDRGYSGGNTNRPAFESLLSDIRAGKIEKVIVYKLDRISRSILDFANIIELFRKNNVEFLSSTEKFDTSTPIGNAMLNITMVFAQLERETIQKRIRDNYYARGKKGFFTGGMVPYGFSKVQTKVDGGKAGLLVKNPEQMPFLIKMYEMYSQSDLSLGKISNYLNGNEIPAPKGGLWDSCKVSRILRSPLYVRADADIYLYYKNKGCNISNDISEFVGINGCYLFGRREAGQRKYTKVEDHVLSIALHEGVIDSQMWLYCQYKLDGNKQLKNSGKGKHSWLSGYVKCGYCGYAVSVYSAEDYKYLKCRGRTNYKRCRGFSSPVYVEKIEGIIERYILERAKELRNTTVRIQNTDNMELNKLKLQIIEIESQIENLLNRLAEGNSVTMKYINEKITGLDESKSDMMEKIRKLSIDSIQARPIDDVTEYIKMWWDFSLEEKKSICGYFINRMFIKDDEIEIDWKL